MQLTCLKIGKNRSESGKPTTQLLRRFAEWFGKPFFKFKLC